MTELEFDFTWEDPGNALGDELRATWARLGVSVRGVQVTQVLDTRSRTVRDYIYVPLYPLAEWLATHYWWLLNEIPSHVRRRETEYERRHSLRFAREGYALPNLRIEPDGANVRLQWNRYNLSDCRVTFLDDGCTTIASGSFEEAAAKLIEATLDRLQQLGVATNLDEEWREIRSMDVEQRDFCKVAAQLGLDPFDLDPTQADNIVRAYEKFPAKLASEFFTIASPLLLNDQAQSLDDAVSELQQLDVELPKMTWLRSQVGSGGINSTPWREGYNIARVARQSLGLDKEHLSSFDRLLDAFEMTAADWRNAHIDSRPDCGFFDAVVAPNKNQSPAFLIQKQRDESRKFAFCRAVFEFLNAANDDPALVSESRSQQQQRNRAFAAEFLAPEVQLRERISGATVDASDIDDLAADFGVSSFVIQHQVQNHRIAELLSDADTLLHSDE